MLKFILIVIVLMLLFRALRKFIFFSAHNAFNQAAQDFMKRQEAQDRQRKKKVVCMSTLKLALIRMISLMIMRK